MSSGNVMCERGWRVLVSPRYYAKRRWIREGLERIYGDDCRLPTAWDHVRDIYRIGEDQGHTTAWKIR